MSHRDTDRMTRVVDPEIRLAFELPDGRRHSLPHCHPLSIGSAKSCALQIRERFVSCLHARVTFSKKTGYQIEDLGSTNGTLVDGVRIDRALLEPGMQVALGHARLSVIRADKPETRTRLRRAVGQPSAERPVHPRHCLVGRSPAMTALKRTLEKLASVALPVAIYGETGTGKELAARTLHEFGPAVGQPFVAINCGAIPSALFESELFGHRRGAFTGATRDHVGAFVRAGRGTVFLDEIGELPPSAQAKLLRVLETRSVSPVGSEREVAVSCRVIAATHRRLAEMVDAGQFREDLYHRLSVVEVELPPLRQRKADVPILLDHFLDQAASELGRPVVASQAAVKAAHAHDWPGNVRALRNAVFRAAALADGPIEAEALIPAGRRPRLRAGAITVPRGTYASMNAALLQQIVAEEGSIRKAARVLDVPRSTLGAWMQRL